MEVAAGRDWRREQGVGGAAGGRRGAVVGTGAWSGRTVCRGRHGTGARLRIWGDAEGGIPADAPLHLLMLAASRVMTAYYVGTLAQAGVQVSPAGLGVLRILLAVDGLKSSDVAARGWSSPGTLTSVVNTLVREGYVERRSDAGDRRVVRLYLTDQGRRTCRGLLRAGRAGLAGRVRLRERGRRARGPQVLHRHDRAVQRADQEGANPVTRNGDGGRFCQPKLTEPVRQHRLTP